MDATPNNSIRRGEAPDATHTDPADWTPNYPPGNAANELKDLHPYTAEVLQRLGLPHMIIQGVGNDWSSFRTHYATGYFYPDADGRSLGKPLPITDAVDLYIGPFTDPKGNVIWTQDQVNSIVHQLRMAGLPAWFRKQGGNNLNNHIHLVDPVISEINEPDYNQIIDFMRSGIGSSSLKRHVRDPSVTLAERQAVARRYNQGNFGDNELMTIPQR